MITAGGQNLRIVREQLGLTMRDVETASERLARKHANEEYFVPISRLSDFETKGVIPSIYRLYSLTIIYRRDLRELLNWYGVNLDATISDMEISVPPRSHFSHALANTSTVQIPIRMDPSFDPRKTLNFGRMIEQWGTVPLVYLEGLSILPPSSFIQVDETKSKVSEGGWRSEYERPIYFIETRDGHTCCWCTLTREDIILQPHPLSPVAPRVFGRHEAEVLGQVVGVAMRLGEWRSVPDSAPAPKERATLN